MFVFHVQTVKINCNRTRSSFTIQIHKFSWRQLPEAFGITSILDRWKTGKKLFSTQSLKMIASRVRFKCVIPIICLLFFYRGFGQQLPTINIRKSTFFWSKNSFIFRNFQNLIFILLISPSKSVHQRRRQWWSKQSCSNGSKAHSWNTIIRIFDWYETSRRQSFGTKGIYE